MLYPDLNKVHPMEVLADLKLDFIIVRIVFPAETAGHLQFFRVVILHQGSSSHGDNAL